MTSVSFLRDFTTDWRVCRDCQRCSSSMRNTQKFSQIMWFFQRTSTCLRISRKSKGLLMKNKELLLNNRKELWINKMESTHQEMEAVETTDTRIDSAHSNRTHRIFQSFQLTDYLTLDSLILLLTLKRVDLLKPLLWCHHASTIADTKIISRIAQ